MKFLQVEVVKARTELEREGELKKIQEALGEEKSDEH